jgi:hypothetical protein
MSRRSTRGSEPSDCLKTVWAKFESNQRNGNSPLGSALIREAIEKELSGLEARLMNRRLPDHIILRQPPEPSIVLQAHSAERNHRLGAIRFLIKSMVLLNDIF